MQASSAVEWIIDNREPRYDYNWTLMSEQFVVK